MNNYAEEEIVDLLNNIDRAYAAIAWFAKVRQLVVESAVVVKDPVNMLAAAHALSEIWLSGDKIRAVDVATSFGWTSGEAVRELLSPLMDDVSPPLIIRLVDGDDLRPNIQLGNTMTCFENKSCTCDDFCDDPCSDHWRENQLQDEAIRLRNELYNLKKDAKLILENALIKTKPEVLAAKERILEATKEEP